MALSIRPVTDGDRDWILQRIEEAWGLPVVGLGRLHDVGALPGFVCADGPDVAGLATYHTDARDCELVTLNAFKQRDGVGTALLEAVADAARAAGCARLWLVTTNDNLPALRFYQRRGLRLVAVHRDAMDEVRKHKPQLPELGEHGIPLRDMLELELDLRRLDRPDPRP